MSTEIRIDLAPENNPEERVASFIRKTYSILEESLFPEIIDWNDEGNALVIKKTTEFAQKVLPKYFKHNHISSFIRQLNMYSFQKKRTRHPGHVYMHELFQKGQKHLLAKIKRKGKELSPSHYQTSTHASQATSPKDINQDHAALLNENQILRGLKDNALSKLESLQQKIKELTLQNQVLMNQLQKKGNKEDFKIEKDQDDYITPPALNPSTSLTINTHPSSMTTRPSSRGEKDENSPMDGNPFAIKQNLQGGYKIDNFFGSIKQPFTFNQQTNKPKDSTVAKIEFVPQGQFMFNRVPNDLRVSNIPSNGPMINTLSLKALKYESPMVSLGLLGKRELDGARGNEEDGISETFKKLLKGSPFDNTQEKSLLCLEDMNKLQISLFKSIGIDDHDQRLDSEVDLLCFH